MIRLVNNELALPDGTVIPFGSGNFSSLKEMEQEIILAIYRKLLMSNHKVTFCYFETARLCGVSGRKVENMITGRHVRKNFP